VFVIPKTKIVCTIGPGTESLKQIKKLVQAGMSIARINFSHGNYDQYAGMIKHIKSASRSVGILLDTKGPEVRTGLIHDNVHLSVGQLFTLTTRKIVGNSSVVHVTYAPLPKQMKRGDPILIDDGLIELRVEKVKGKDVICRVISSGDLGNQKSVTLPKKKIKLQSITKKDEQDIRFGLRHGIDFIAASFTRSGRDILEIKKIAKSHPHVKVIAKIECQEAVNNFYDILSVADGVMVARGDLGVELPLEDVPLIQKFIIEQCNLAGKPVITATQMLETMVYNKRPTRAETSDVANAILDGTDAVMLSEETAIGKYPFQAVKFMRKIAEKIEPKILGKHKHTIIKSDDAIAKAVFDIAKVTKIKKVIVCTYSGFSAELVSKYRPDVDIIAVTPVSETVRQLSLVWGAEPVLLSPAMEHRIHSTGDLIKFAVKEAYKNKFVKKDEKVLITAAHPLNIRKRTNLLEIHEVRELLK
jgi:pyruvate kinase